MTFLLYFGLGVLSDLFVTAYYLCVARCWRFRAAMTSALVSLASFYVLDKVIMGQDWRSAVAYAAGNAVGCFVIMSIGRRPTGAG